MCAHALTAKVELRASAERVDDVNDEAVGGGAQRERPCGHQQRHHVKQVGQVSRHVQQVVEGQHEHVACQDGDVVPHQVLFQRRRRGQARLIDDLAHADNNLGKEVQITEGPRFKTLKPGVYCRISSLVIRNGGCTTFGPDVMNENIHVTGNSKETHDTE